MSLGNNSGLWQNNLVPTVYLRTDDPLRGGKLAAFVLYMTTKTTLVYALVALQAL